MGGIAGGNAIAECATDGNRHDVVFLVNTLHRFTPEQLEGQLSRIRRALSPLHHFGAYAASDTAPLASRRAACRNRRTHTSRDPP
jgi:hypothetical protein